MPSLVEQLGTETIRPIVITETVALIDAQVKQKGFMIKSAYAVIKGIKKSFIPETVAALLNDWLTKLQPHYDKWSAGPAQTSFSDYVIARSDDVAEDLLSVTDERAKNTSHGTARKMYEKMRDGAKKNVIEAIPDLSRMIEKHLPPKA
ncbi:hypothetical protein BH11MYX2_BH11MYX2_06220 [soil metagenome]